MKIQGLFLYIILEEVKMVYKKTPSIAERFRCKKVFDFKVLDSHRQLHLFHKEHYL